MNGHNSLPTALPVHVDQLIRELDEIISPAEVTNTKQLDNDGCLHLAFNAGRRSVVEELLRLLDKETE